LTGLCTRRPKCPAPRPRRGRMGRCTIRRSSRPKEYTEPARCD
jgi:hypothetical protein